MLSIQSECARQTNDPKGHPHSVKDCHYKCMMSALENRPNCFFMPLLGYLLKILWLGKDDGAANQMILLRRTSYTKQTLPPANVASEERQAANTLLLVHPSKNSSNPAACQDREELHQGGQPDWTYWHGLLMHMHLQEGRGTEPGWGILTVQCTIPRHLHSKLPPQSDPRQSKTEQRLQVRIQNIHAAYQDLNGARPYHHHQCPGQQSKGWDGLTKYDVLVAKRCTCSNQPRSSDSVGVYLEMQQPSWQVCILGFFFSKRWLFS